MKKSMIIVILVFFLLYMTTSASIDSSLDKAYLKQLIISEIPANSAVLASFLFHMGKLDEFVDVDPDDIMGSLNSAVFTFNHDESIYQQAAERAKCIISESEIMLSKRGSVTVISLNCG